MIEAIKIQESAENYYLSSNGMRRSYLFPLKHINIFIGENNSGKSRLLRRTLQRDISDYFRAEERDKGDNSIIIRLGAQINNFNIIAKQRRVEELCLSMPGDKKAITVLTYLKDKVEESSYNSLSDYHLSQEITKIRQSILDLERDLFAKAQKENSRFLSRRVYIPVLRGVECFQNYYDRTDSQLLDDVKLNKREREALEKYKDSVKTIYKSKIAKVYGVSENEVFTGENLYEEIMNKLLGVEQDRLFVKNFQDFISDSFYDGKEFQLIPNKDKQYLNVKIGETEERALHDFGDGIKQLICILYKAFEMKEEESLFFVEEPEINLHPGYQRKLIELLQDDIFSKLQFFITTHSNHLVDSCFDYENVSLFKFINIDSQNKQFKIISSTRGDIELLDLLGVNNSSVFMANSTIWVEGLSDKILIEKYLEIYIEKKCEKKYVEGIDYSFVEYGGDNVVHWSFVPEETIDEINASDIANRVFLIADNDGGKKRKRKENLARVLGERFYELPVREIENTIEKAVLEKTLFRDGDVRIVNKKKYKNANYNNTKANFFEYIADHYDTKRKYWDNKKNAVSISKIDFSREIVANIHDYEDLSKEAVELCERICRFLDSTGKVLD